MPNPTPGTIVGAYRVDGSLGSGSMGEVFKGVDTGLNRRVAIKILSEKHRDSPELRARFVREGRAVAAISHPNVVQVFATGTYDERPYIVMELLDGTDLGTAVEKGRPLDSATAAHAVLDAAQGLAAASKAGLIHRDVKPSNLVRLSDGKVKVTDFGLAKPVDPGAEPALTAMGVVVGTPDYIAPEQARGETIDERVDIYALGGTLYFLLTGIPPFRTGKPAEDKYLKVVARHLRNPPPDASVTNPNADRELADLAKQLMAKKPSERPTYDELTQRLLGIIARLDPGGVPMMLSNRERSSPNLLIPDSGRKAAPGAIPDSSRKAMPSGPHARSGPSRPPGPAPELPDASGPSSRGATSIGAGESIAPPPRAFPGWLVGFTFLCVALFAAGLVVYLRKDNAAPPTKPAAAPPDAGVAAPPPDAALQVPAGMIVVKKADGSPAFFVDAKPISVETYREVFAKQGEASKQGGVVSVTYTEARSFVTTRGGRLLTATEWDQAANTPGFVASDGLYEWVESPDDKKRMVHAAGKNQTRPDAKHKDVTFRMAKNL